MHSFIYEITQTRLDREDWTNDLDLSEDRIIDYCQLLSDDEDDSERLQAIEYLKSCKWFGEAFEETNKPDVFISKDVSPLIKEWHNRIQQETENLVKSGKTNTFYLQEAIDYPFGGSQRFVLPDWGSSMSEPMRELLEMLADVGAGTKIYINAVFDYHY